MRGKRPTGTMSFLFSDVEGSTSLWERHPAAMAEALRRHDAVVRGAIESHGGYVFSTAGDAFAAAFSRPGDALDAALAAQAALATQAWPEPAALRVRMGLHVGEADERGGDYFGPTLNRTARLMAAAHGGQVVASSTFRDLLPGAGFADLGTHQLKDLSVPERIWQALGAGLAERFPPLRTLDPRRHNLPASRSSFVGRADDLAGVAAALAASRLVTLVGAGGAGKTRLALHAAAEAVDRYPDGVWLVELAGIEEGSLLAGALVDVLGVPRQRRPDLGVAVDHLAPRRALVVLDNCEHVVDDAAALADELLRRCADVAVLATSREPLGLDGEELVEVAPLPTAGAGSPSVQLFLERARAGGVRCDGPADLDAVASVCEHLDGLPLAIELAAARARSLAVPELARHLDRRFRLITTSRRDVPARHRSLEAVVAWSYDQLGDPQRRVFDRIGVWAGSFGPDQAAAVSGVDELDAIDVLAQLLDKSLVLRADVPGRTRYRALETMRQWGVEQLERRGELGATRGALVDWAVELTRASEASLVQGDRECLARLDLELANIRAALGAAVDDPGLAPLGLEVAGRLGRYWFLRTL